MSTADHGARAHATWSASSTAANWTCPGRLALVDGQPDQESRSAAWGTVCHQIAETCLRDGQAAESFVGRIIRTKEHTFEVDEEMAETTQVYVDYINIDTRGYVNVEQRFDLTSLGGPIDAGGTCDAVCYDPEKQHIEVVDLKCGQGVVVEAKGNQQLRTYALGAMLANPGLAVRTIAVTIVQPRAPHADGRIRSETFELADLIEWTADLVAAMRRSKTAMDAKLKMDSALWADSFLRAGEHCRFCPAAGFCPALGKEALAVADAFFAPTGEIEMPASDVDHMRPERVAAILDKADLLEGWLNAVRARGQWLAESGVEVPGYQLVAKQSRRKWIDEAAARTALCDAFFDEDVCDHKLKSPTQVEKSIGKAKYEAIVAPLVSKESSGVNLVAAAKTTRPAVQAPADKFFGPN